MKNKTQTSDVYFSAAMLAVGARLDSVDRTDPRHMQFTLVMDEYKFVSKILNDAVSSLASFQADFEYYEKEWANRTLQINAWDFKDALQRMKSVIHSK